MSNISTPIVFVIDHDITVRESLAELIRTAGWHPETFATASEFLSYPRQAVPSCLILDVALPDLDGLELQERVAAIRRDMPIIFLVDYADIPTTVRAMKRGALDFLTKPFDAELLLRGIRHAIKRSEAALGRENEMRMLRTGYGTLTHREREVMKLVVSGFLNKQVGGQLGISEITVKAHRGNVMRKMKADSFAELVNMAARLRITNALTMSHAWV